MSLIRALAAEEAGLLEQAVLEYESQLASTPDDLEAFVNVLVLYWQATDYGFSATHRLSPSFVTRAGERVGDLSKEGERRFPDAPEVKFWIPYIRWAEQGEGITTEHCRELMREHPEYLEPAVFLFAKSGGTEHEIEANSIRLRCEISGTTRCRYLVSVIDGVLKRRRPRK